jgi:hypothetical protein
LTGVEELYPDIGTSLNALGPLELANATFHIPEERIILALNAYNVVATDDAESDSSAKEILNGSSTGTKFPHELPSAQKTDGDGQAYRKW